jgi:RecA/RadA recombinase
MATKKKVEGKPQGTISALQVIENNLKTNKDDHYNFIKEVSYKVSTGSIVFDYYTDGGITPGIVRLVGPTESGKTSEALTMAKNFQDTIPNSMVVYVKAEGRLDPRLIERHGIDISPERWFKYDTEIFDACFKLITDLVHKTEGIKYMFIIDSLDGLLTRADKGKTYEESAKIAGGATIASAFFKKVSLGLRKKGHIAIFMSQERVNKMPTGGYAEFAHVKASGGNAALHYPDWIFEFLPIRKSDLIREGDSLDGGGEKKGKNGKIVGSRARVMIKKSPNEMTYEQVTYPIKRRTKVGNSIWLEREILSCILDFGILERSGAWFNFEESVVEDAKAEGIDLSKKIQGDGKATSMLEESPEILEFLKKKVYEIMNSLRD